MRRRTFLTSMLAAAASLTAVRAAPNPQDRKRTLVAIGVDKAGSLPTLNGAARGAREVATWLKREGFETKLFTDELGPVTFSSIRDFVAGLVDRETLDQLVIYFSGHGFLNGYSEYWMLSGAPRYPNEAISLVETATLARESGIPHVVLISDACRSTPDSIGASRVRGDFLFQNSGISRNVRTFVDQFFAALPGSPALEIPVADSTKVFEGIYTASLLSAFNNPVDTFVRTIDGVRCIPNWYLQTYLERDVVRRAEEKTIRLHQRPDAMIMSGERTYIARVANPATATPSSGDPSASVREFGAFQLKRAGAGKIVDFEPTAQLQAFDPALARFVVVQNGVTSATIEAQMPRVAFSIDDRRMDILVVGGILESVTVGKDLLVKHHVGNEASVSILDARAGSVILKFGDGTGTVVPALRGFTCSIVVERNGVSSVNYLRMGQQSDARLDELHAAVTAAAESGVFRISGPRENSREAARDFGNRIRIGKGVDPSLGVYAAYAYAQADLIDEARSVAEVMRADLNNVVIFDVAMLARELGIPGLVVRQREYAVAPFCPMLSQGWNLTRALQVQVDPVVAEARDHIRSSLWTTFEREGVRILDRALLSGRVK